MTTYSKTFILKTVKDTTALNERSKTMTSTQIDNRVRKLKALEAEQKKLEAEAEAIKNELKAELEALEAEELTTTNFTVRWKEVISNRLDSKALKNAMPTVYEKFCKTSTSKRFTIA